MGVYDSRTRRDGRAIELLGSYDPFRDGDERYQLDRERITYWLGVGALPTETVQAILLSQGVDVPSSGKARALSPEERAAKQAIREQKKQKKEEALQRKAALAASKQKLSKKEMREAKKAGLL